MTRESKGVLIAAGALAPLVHLGTLLILGAVWPGYDHTSHAISELGMSSAEVSPFMNIVGFGATGLLVSTFGFAFVGVLEIGGLSLIATTAWLGAGLSFAALGLWPYPEFRHLEVLLYCSILAIVAMISATLALSLEIRSRLLWPLTVVAVLAVASYLWLPSYGERFGLIQRVHLGGIVLWLELAAFHLWRIRQHEV